MLGETKNSILLAEWLPRIDSPECQDAFRYLIGLAACLPNLACYPQLKGEVQDFRFFSENGEQRYAFIVNKQWLLFYFRLPTVRSGRHHLPDLRKAFDSVNVNAKGEWTVKLRSIDDVRRLWEIISA